MNSSPSDIPPQIAPSSASTLQRFFRVLPAFIAGGLAMTGIQYIANHNELWAVIDCALAAFLLATAWRRSA